MLGRRVCLSSAPLLFNSIAGTLAALQNVCRPETAPETLQSPTHWQCFVVVLRLARIPRSHSETQFYAASHIHQGRSCGGAKTSLSTTHSKKFILCFPSSSLHRLVLLVRISHRLHHKPLLGPLCPLKIGSFCSRLVPMERLLFLAERSLRRNVDSRYAAIRLSSFSSLTCVLCF